MMRRSSLDIDDEVVSVKSLYGDYDTPQDFLEAFDSLVQRSPERATGIAGSY